MKSNVFLIVFFLFNCYQAFAQPKGAMDNLNRQYSSLATNERVSFKHQLTKNNNTNISNFLNFYIPSSITSEGIEPAAVSNLNVDFGDDKVKLKWGYSGKKNEEKFFKNFFRDSGKCQSSRRCKDFV